MTTEQQTSIEEAPQHPFHRRGLGAPPYRFIEQEESIFRATPGAPAQPGTSCDYCHTPIIGTFWFMSKDGKKFKVGCDCLRKAAKDANDYPLQTLAARLARKQSRDARHAREKQKLVELDALLATQGQALEAFAHPVAYRANQGGTMLEYAQWMRKHAGATGCMLALKLCKEAIEKTTEQKEVT